jgi:hypothetical protein
MDNKLKFDPNQRIGECRHGNNMVQCLQCKHFYFGQETKNPFKDPSRAQELAGIERKPDMDEAPAKFLNITGYRDIDEFLTDVFDTMAKKGHDYRQGNDADLLHNFRTVAETVGSTKEKIWFTYFYKHYAAMTTFIKEGGQQESEPIEGRIKDMIVYLVLFYRMVQENKRKNATKMIKVDVGSIPPSPELEKFIGKVKTALKKVEVSVGEVPSLGKVQVDPIRAQELAGLREVRKTDELKDEALGHMVEDNLSPTFVENTRDLVERLAEREKEKELPASSNLAPRGALSPKLYELVTPERTKELAQTAEVPVQAPVVDKLVPVEQPYAESPLRGHHL